MSKRTGVKGKTPYALSRALDAADRLVAYQQRTVDEQVALLNTRPGKALRERARLTKRLLEEAAE